MQHTVEPPSPLNSIADQPEVSVTKPGLTVGENGEVVKVPAFLNKLYSMVSDPETEELIYWAESGDSFFVPNHERFGKELLPRFFKHANFSSFVRQLNMYGFHKVPHLQSGVLKNESPSELWEFVNPFFKRDQPQLLARVTRKNNRPVATPTTPATPGSSGTRTSARQAAAATAQIAPGNPGYPGVHLLTDGTTQGEAGPLVSMPHLADLQALQTGINAIRQTQAAIGADLKALQTSNEHLWREAIESRERSTKHEETIDLIVSFLERLFGTEGEGLKGLKEAMRRGVMTRNREDSTSEEPGASAKKRRRLLIEGGAGGTGGGGANGSATGGGKPNAGTDANNRFSEVQDPSPNVESRSSRSGSEPWNSAGPRFATLATDDEASPYSHSRSGSLKSGVSAGGQDQTLHPGGFSPLSDVPELRTDGSNALQQYVVADLANYLGTHANSNQQDMTGMNLDPALLDTTIGSLLQSPAAAQMFYNTLSASVQGQALQTPDKMTAPSPPVTDPNHNDPTLALFSPLPNPALTDHNQDLLGAFHKAVGVNGDVDHLQDSIDSLVRSMGLDLPAGMSHNPTPNTSTTTTAPTTASDPSVPSNAGQAGAQYDDSDFNVDDFLDQLQANHPNGTGVKEENDA